MTADISHTTIDCANAYELSEWWKGVLGYVDVAGDPNEPGDEECMILSPESGHRLLFIQVPEQKQVKNRVHFDVRPRDRSQAAEVDHLIGLGAREIADHRGIYGLNTGWVTLVDPQGNEFCVLRNESVS